MKNKIFFPNLDGLRFWAAMLVFWQHSTETILLELRTRGFIGELPNTGAQGVSFFFVLSGFLITFLLLQEIEQNGKIDIKAFYVRRILRIFPLYYLVLFWGFVCYPFLRMLMKMPDIFIGVFPLYAFFLGNFDVIYSSNSSIFVSITWSVGIEEQFYIFWAILFLVLPRHLFKYLFPLIIISSTLFRFYYQSDAKIVYYHTFSVMSDLAIGGWMAYIAIYNQGFIDFFSRLKRSYIILVYSIGISLMWVLPTLLKWFFPETLWLDQSVWIQRLIFSLFFAFIIAEQNYSEFSFYKMKNFKWFSKLGIYTYGFYLLHPTALYLVFTLFTRILHSDQTNLALLILQILLELVLAIFLSYLSYEFFESRFLRLKQRFNA